jgi:hypothetical protein
MYRGGYLLGVERGHWASRRLERQIDGARGESFGVNANAKGANGGAATPDVTSPGRASQGAARRLNHSQ